jgi:hypothetical protein
MNAWSGWDFQRFYLLFVALAFVVVGVSSAGSLSRSWDEVLRADRPPCSRR